MPSPLRSFVVAGSLLAAAAGLAGCGSGDSDAGPTTTRATTTTETEAERPTTSATTSTTAVDPGTSTTAATATELPDCQQLLTEYSEVFTPDDLSGAVVFFRKYAPFMPDEVGAATQRLADAYDDAGDQLENLDFGDVDLTADAQTFSDWTNDGCPPG